MFDRRNVKLVVCSLECPGLFLQVRQAFSALALALALALLLAR